MMLESVPVAREKMEGQGAFRPVLPGGYVAFDGRAFIRIPGKGEIDLPGPAPF